MKRYAFIYNPAARGGRTTSQLQALESKIPKLDKAKLFRSQSKGNISHLVKDQLPNFDIFVACGGDGTVREVASQLIYTEKTLGIIPLGTGNDLSKTLKIPNSFEQAFNLLFNGEITEIDVGWCNDIIFLNSLGFGFDGLTNRYAAETPKLPPILRYMYAALKATIYQDSFEVDIRTDRANRSQRAIMVSVANGRIEGGSFWIAPNASITDGKFDLVTIRPIKKWLIPILLPLFLIKKPHWIPYVNIARIGDIHFRFNRPVEIHADGEIIKNNDSEFYISMNRSRLNVISQL